VDYLEADDIVGYLAYKPEFGECIICSPDKDLKQIPGTLYDYKKGEMMIITPEAAEDHFKMQMLCGDATDNIKGVPGLGPVKARAKLSEGKSVYDLYVDYFGTHYGAIIYAETLATVQVIQPGHSHESFFNRRLDFITPIEITF
jgi:5'-3' exonuclease